MRTQKQSKLVQVSFAVVVLVLIVSGFLRSLQGTVVSPAELASGGAIPRVRMTDLQNSASFWSQRTTSGQPLTVHSHQLRCSESASSTWRILLNTKTIDRNIRLAEIVSSDKQNPDNKIQVAVRPTTPSKAVLNFKVTRSGLVRTYGIEVERDGPAILRMFATDRNLQVYLPLIDSVRTFPIDHEDLCGTLTIAPVEADKSEPGSLTLGKSLISVSVGYGQE
jgi:hypothetical protein